MELQKVSEETLVASADVKHEELINKLSGSPVHEELSKSVSTSLEISPPSGIPSSPDDIYVSPTALRYSNARASLTELAPFSWKKLFKFMGPAFLVSIAYMDPGNLDSDIQSGSQFEYQLLWVIIWASGLGLLLQILAMKLGVITRRNLAQLCAEEFVEEKYTKYALFIIAELTIIASDIPEVVGTAIALNLLGNVPLWLGVLLTAFSVFVFLGLERFGARYLEIFIAMLIAVILFSFLAQVGLTHVPFETMAVRSIIPEIRDLAAIYSLIALLGSVVMPHNLFLHSGLVQSREFGKSTRELKEACLYNSIESAFAIFISVMVNISVISVAAKNFFFNDNTGLRSAPELLNASLGGGQTASILFAVALLASGQSSTMTGTFAGQIVMEGFIDLKMSNFKRSMLTRGLAIFPSLIVAVLYGQNGADDLIVFSQVFLSFLLPYPLVCLIKLTNSTELMGKAFVNSTRIKYIAIVLGILVTIANVLGLFFTVWDPIAALDSFGTQFVCWLVVIGIFAVYLWFLLYLVRRPFHCQRYATLPENPAINTRTSVVLKEIPGELPPEMGLFSRYSYYTLAQLR